MPSRVPGEGSRRRGGPSATVDHTTRRALLPIGSSVIEWTATSPSGLTTTALQTATVRAVSGPACCAQGQEILVGDDLANAIVSPVERNYCVLARGGGDFVQTKGGSDLLLGEEGADALHSGGGVDVVLGGPGDDAIHGGLNGRLRAFGGPGADALNGSFSESAELVGGDGADLLVGGSGADRLIPGPGADFASGGAGDDTVVIHHVCEVPPGTFLDGGPGTDTLVTPVPVNELRARGAVVTSFERIVVDATQRYLSECFAE